MFNVHCNPLKSLANHATVTNPFFWFVSPTHTPLLTLCYIDNTECIESNNDGEEDEGSGEVVGLAVPESAGRRRKRGRVL